MGDFLKKDVKTQTMRWAPEASLVVLTLADRIFDAGMPPHPQKRLNTNRAPTLKLWIEKYGRFGALSVLNFAIEP